jgi:hypothetical protein
MAHLALVFVTPVFLGQSATAQTEEQSIVLSDVSCKDVMGQGGDERDRSISFLHGYVAGDAGTTEVNVEVLVDLTETFIDTCLDNPTAGALETLKQIVQ